MKSKLLPKNFLKNNPVDELSAANLIYFKTQVATSDEYDHMMSIIEAQSISAERRKAIEEGKELISELGSAEEIVSFMRSKYDIANQHLLCRKALSMQSEVIPLMLRRYRTTYQDVFVDAAVQIFAAAEKCYTEDLFHIYEDIRDSYAKSMACLVFGIKHIEEALPLLLKEYEQMKMDYTDKSLCQGPLLGIHILCEEKPLPR